MRRSSLKRTAFRSKARPERQVVERIRAPLTPIRVPAPSPEVFHQAPKGDFERLAAYRAWVKTFPCFGCGAQPPTVCCHANEGKGQGLKVSDRRVFPLCCPCHEALDQSKGITRDERRTRERAYVARMQGLVIEAGRKEFV